MKKILLLAITFIFLSSCNTSGLKSDLILIEDIALPISEPSGITSNSKNLVIVSDSNGIIYTTTFGGDYISEETTHFEDLEGITTINNNTIAIVDEKERQLAIISNNEIKKIKIRGENHFNTGLEGVAYNSSDKTFWVVQEKNPVKLINIDASGNILNNFLIDFTADLSGLYFDKDLNLLWAVSDENQTIYQISLKGKLLNAYKIPVFKAEGITIVNNIIYVVSDAYNKLYLFEKPKLQ